MGDPRGFLKVERVEEDERPINERVQDWREIVEHAAPEQVREQASRCMECGIPFCHQGCPLGNLIPEWNDLVHKGKLGEAARRLAATNNFPEVTGRVCPAPCEAACVLNIRDEPVSIKTIERTIADEQFAQMPLVPSPAGARTGKRVAVIGSGPAGLAAAQQLARAGHDATLFERDDRIGGLLRYGIPDFNMEKGILDARIEQMRGGGRRVPRRSGGGVGASGRAASARLRRRRSHDGRAGAARSSDSRTRATRGSLRDGVPRAAESPLRWGFDRLDAPHPRHGQARRRHRWGRHGIRLCRDVAPSGSPQRDAARAHAEAESLARSEQPLARMAAGSSYLELARRGRRARLGGIDPGVPAARTATSARWTPSGWHSRAASMKPMPSGASSRFRPGSCSSPRGFVGPEARRG